MRLLLDENLSPRLVSRLSGLYGAITHVRDNGLQQSSDRGIWDWAKQHGHIVVTADSDFVALSQKLGFPPKIVHFEQCDFSFHVMEDILRRNAVRIAQFAKNENAGVLSLRVVA